MQGFAVSGEDCSEGPHMTGAPQQAAVFCVSLRWPNMPADGTALAAAHSPFAPLPTFKSFGAVSPGEHRACASSAWLSNRWHAGRLVPLVL